MVSNIQLLLLYGESFSLLFPDLFEFDTFDRAEFDCLLDRIVELNYWVYENDCDLLLSTRNGLIFSVQYLDNLFYAPYIVKYLP